MPGKIAFAKFSADIIGIFNFFFVLTSQNFSKCYKTQNIKNYAVKNRLIFFSNNFSGLNALNFKY